MRKIEFRVWNKEKKHFIDPLSIALDGTGLIGIWRDQSDNYDFKRQDNFEISLFTGLFDKNGKKIFEGDIVQWLNSNFAVEYLGGCFYAGLMSLSSDGITGNKWKVIGNIYENQELLK